jgi:hypothetical protein
MAVTSHVIDVLGGFVLGVFCLYLFDDAPFSLPSIPNRRISGYYALTAIVLVLCGLGSVSKPNGRTTT